MPMKFISSEVKYRRLARWGTMRPTEFVVVTCKDTLPDGNFDLEWEYVSSHRAALLCPDKEYGWK